MSGYMWQSRGTLQMSFQCIYIKQLCQQTNFLQNLNRDSVGDCHYCVHFISTSRLFPVLSSAGQSLPRACGGPSAGPNSTAYTFVFGCTKF